MDETLLRLGILHGCFSPLAAYYYYALVSRHRIVWVESFVNRRNSLGRTKKPQTSAVNETGVHHLRQARLFPHCVSLSAPALSAEQKYAVGSQQQQQQQPASSTRITTHSRSDVMHQWGQAAQLAIDGRRRKRPGPDSGRLGCTPSLRFFL